MRIRLPHAFEPRGYQIAPLAALDRGVRRLMTVWHRRSGKDVTWWNAIIKKSQERVGIYYYVLPTFRQARKIIWDGISGTGFRYLDHIPRAIRDGKPNDTEMKVRMKNGSLIQLIGSDHYDSMVGTNPVGIVYSEYALQEDQGWHLMRPILVENGGWAAFNTTPRGHNHAFDLKEIARESKEWFYSELGIQDTVRADGKPVMTRAQVEEEIMQGMDRDLSNQEYDVSWEGPNEGSYYGKWIENARMDGRVTRIPHDPRLPVHTFWDLGVDDSTAIWFMQNIRDREYRFIEYLEDSGKGLDYYVKELRDRPYSYTAHYLPFDINVRELGAKGAQSRLKTLTDLGVRNVIVNPNSSPADKVSASRMVLPLCWFDEVRCAGGIKALMAYKRERDEKKKVWKNTPLHDWSSHCASAFGEFGIGFKDKVASKARPSQDSPRGAGSWMR